MESGREFLRPPGVSRDRRSLRGRQNRRRRARNRSRRPARAASPTRFRRCSCFPARAARSANRTTDPTARVRARPVPALAMMRQPARPWDERSSPSRPAPTSGTVLFARSGHNWANVGVGGSGVMSATVFSALNHLPKWSSASSAVSNSGWSSSSVPLGRKYPDVRRPIPPPFQVRQQSDPPPQLPAPCAAPLPAGRTPRDKWGTRRGRRPRRDRE